MKPAKGQTWIDHKNNRRVEVVSVANDVVTYTYKGRTGRSDLKRFTKVCTFLMGV